MWIAKNQDGTVILFYKKPRRKNGYWLSVDGKYFVIDSSYAKGLKWEDEPRECKLWVKTNVG